MMANQSNPRSKSILDKFNDVIRYSALEEEEDIAPYVEETEDNVPNPFEQKVIILVLVFMYTFQSFALQFPTVISVYMSHEIEQCKDRYYVEKYLDNVMWPVSFKILFAPIVDLVPLCCFKKTYHRRGYIYITGIMTATILFLLAYNWSSIDPHKSCPDAPLLFVYLFGIILFTAIGGVALDGLAILALQGKNLGYFSMISKVGTVVGKNGISTAFLFLEKTIGVRICYVIVGSCFLLSLFFLRFMKEQVQESANTNALKSHKESRTLLTAYKLLYRVICNRHALFFGFAGMAFYRIWRGAFVSAVDVTNIGYTKSEVALEGIIEFVPTLLSLYLITKYLGARVNAIKKLKYLYPVMIVGCGLFVLTIIIPPYMNGTTSSDLKEKWVFPFRTIVNIIATPLKNIPGLLIMAHASMVTPVNCPGTFMTFLRTMDSLGRNSLITVRNYIRNMLTTLAEENGYGICSGSKDNLYQGRLTECINNTLFTKTGQTDFVSCNTRNATLIRFCGKEVCRPGQYCSKWGDGYVLFSVLALCFGVMYYMLFWFVIAKRIDKKKIDFDPNNTDERISCCPIYCCGESMYDDYNDVYHTIGYDDDDQPKGPYMPLLFSMPRIEGTEE